MHECESVRVSGTSESASLMFSLSHWTTAADTTATAAVSCKPHLLHFSADMHDRHGVAQLHGTATEQHSQAAAQA